MNKRLKIIKDVDQDPNYPWVKKCLYSEFIWSVFSRIRTDTKRYSVSLNIHSAFGEIRTRKTPNGHFSLSVHVCNLSRSCKTCYEMS